MASPSKFAHVVYQTNRFQELIDWHKTALDARVVHANDFLCFLTYDDEHHRVAIAALPDIEGDSVNRHAPGVMHVAYTFDDLGGLLDNYARLRDAGIKPYWCINHGPTTSMYYADPDGNQIEMQIDNISADEGTKFLQSPAFRDNPIGINYDPEELLEKYQSGVPVEELVVRPQGPPAAIPGV